MNTRARDCGYKLPYSGFCNHPDVRAALKDLPPAYQYHDCGLHPNSALYRCKILFPTNKSKPIGEKTDV